MTTLRTLMILRPPEVVYSFFILSGRLIEEQTIGFLPKETTLKIGKQQRYEYS